MSKIKNNVLEFPVTGEALNRLNALKNHSKVKAYTPSSQKYAVFVDGYYAFSVEHVYVSALENSLTLDNDDEAFELPLCENMLVPAGILKYGDKRIVFEVSVLVYGPVSGLVDRDRRVVNLDGDHCVVMNYLEAQTEKVDNP